MNNTIDIEEEIYRLFYLEGVCNRVASTFSLLNVQRVINLEKQISETEDKILAYYMGSEGEV